MVVVVIIVVVVAATTPSFTIPQDSPLIYVRFKEGCKFNSRASWRMHTAPLLKYHTALLLDGVEEERPLY